MGRGARLGAVVLAPATLLLAACSPNTAAPGSAAPTAATPVPPPTSAPPPSLGSYDWSTYRFPLTCAGVPQLAHRVATGDFSGDQVADAVVAVRCDTGAGSPPSEVYALLAAAEGPRLLATLVDDRTDWLADSLVVAREQVTVTAYAYTPDTPRCCPDLRVRTTYRWDGATLQPAGSATTPATPATQATPRA